MNQRYSLDDAYFIDLSGPEVSLIRRALCSMLREMAAGDISDDHLIRTAEQVAELHGRVSLLEPSSIELPETLHGIKAT